MKAILEQTPNDIICMGNIDPAGVVANDSVDDVKKGVKKLLYECVGVDSNFNPSTGCDVPYHAPWNNIIALYTR